MRKRIVIFVILFLILFASFLVYLKFFKKSEEPVNNRASVIENIEKYSYTLDDRDSKLFKENYLELRKLLAEEEIDYSNYSKILSKLFIIDLYSINNKVNKYDIGSLEYVHPDMQENFKLKIQNTLYKYIVDNSENKRNQDLPEVSSVEVIDFQEDVYEINEIEYKSYVINLEWGYVKDLGYDNRGELVFIKDDDGKLQMVLFNVESENN